jgi:hypothetical protein
VKEMSLNKKESFNHRCLLQGIGNNISLNKKGIIQPSLQIGKRNVSQQKGITQALLSSARDWQQDVSQPKEITQPSLSSARDR